MNFDKSVNIEKFRLYLLELRQIYPEDKLAIYMDNLSVHRSNRIINTMEELGI